MVVNPELSDYNPVLLIIVQSSSICIWYQSPKQWQFTCEDFKVEDQLLEKSQYCVE